MRKIISASVCGSLLLALVLLEGCSKCEVPNCTSTTTIYFRVIDKTTNKDVISELGGSLSDLSLKANNQAIEIQDGRSPNVNYLFASLPNDNVNYTLSYKGKALPFEIVLQERKDTCCKSKQYTLGNVKSDSSTITKDIKTLDTEVYLFPI